MSNWFDEVARELRAAIRRDAHRPWYRRAWRQHRRPLLVALSALVVAAPALAAAGVFSGDTSVSSTTCTQSAASGSATRSHPCTITLSDGRRFTCRPAFAHTQPDAQAVERSNACALLRPVRESERTRVVAAQIATVRSCLLNQGFDVSGGVSPRRAARDAPAGELVIVDGSAPVFIGFYAGAADAQRHLHAAIGRARRSGGRAVARGSAIVLWSREPQLSRQRSVEQCIVG